MVVLVGVGVHVGVAESEGVNVAVWVFVLEEAVSADRLAAKMTVLGLLDAPAAGRT